MSRYTILSYHFVPSPAARAAPRFPVESPHSPERADKCDHRKKSRPGSPRALPSLVVLGPSVPVVELGRCLLHERKDFTYPVVERRETRADSRLQFQKRSTVQYDVTEKEHTR
jgi:hypothetical protein